MIKRPGRYASCSRVISNQWAVISKEPGARIPKTQEGRGQLQRWAIVSRLERSVEQQSRRARDRLFPKILPAPDLSRAGRPTSLSFEATKKTTRWVMQRARRAQIRRECDIVVAAAIRAEIFALPHAVSENTRIGQFSA